MEVHQMRNSSAQLTQSTAETDKCCSSSRFEIICKSIIVLFVFTALLTHSKPKLSQDSFLNSGKVTKLKEGEYRWEPGLKFNHTCRLKFLKKRYDIPCCSSDLANNYQQKHFVSELGDLNLTEVVNTFFHKISHKSVLFLGDSLLRQFARSTWDVLDPGLRQQIQLVKLRKNPSKPSSPIVSKFEKIKIHMPTQNVTFKFVMFCVFQDSTCKTIHPCVLASNHLKLFIEESDIVLFNMGLHFANCTTSSFKLTLEKLAELFKTAASKYPAKQVILRSTLPQHFPGGNGYFDVQKSIEEGFFIEGCANKSTVEEHWSNKYLKNTAKQFGYKYLDSFPIYKDRWDLHWKQTDCTHMCYTAETTVPDIALLNILLHWWMGPIFPWAHQNPAKLVKMYLLNNVINGTQATFTNRCEQFRQSPYHCCNNDDNSSLFVPSHLTFDTLHTSKLFAFVATIQRNFAWIGKNVQFGACST